jgi:signal transduction histidine kinase/DNA-binding response OmpR family regulator
VSLFALAVHHEQDVVTARQRASQLAALLGFDASEQTRIATAVSEIVRNAFRYTGSGRIEFAVEGETAPQLFSILVADTGTGIANLDDVMSGRYRSTTGMGIGIVGAQRLMDRFQIDTGRTGTTVRLKKVLPRRAPFVTSRELSEIARELNDRKPVSLVEEFQRQNQELLRALEELNRRQEELVRLNRELEDTNRGVVALYAELDEKADHLRRADELKSRFLSNMTHEFRTPVNSILAITSLLESRPQPEAEITYLRQAAENLSELVNDLLDLAKVEAGKTEVRPTEFEVRNLFGALRGMLRPLLLNKSVTLMFDEPDDLPHLHTDEGKVSQILRNFISNALKYTEKGHVRVSARLDPATESVQFEVTDTGIGIAEADQGRIFDEFAQVEHPLQSKYKGTGLGLPLSKRLAELLGGRLWVRSEPGLGSTFFVQVPVRYRGKIDDPEPVLAQWQRDATRLPVLVVEDAFEDQLFYEKILKNTPFQPLGVRSLADARRALARLRPAAVILDILLKSEESWSLLCEVKEGAETRGIPVVVVSTVNDRAKALSLGADAYALKPADRPWLLDTLARVTNVAAPPRVLIIDDQDAIRSVLRQFLSARRYTVLEAQTGERGLAAAHAERPQVVLLDLGLPDIDGRDVLRQLKSDPATADIAVVVVTSARLRQEETTELLRAAASIVSKDSLTAETIDHAVKKAIAGTHSVATDA